MTVSNMRLECPICGNENIENEKIFRRDFRYCDSLVPFSEYQVYRCRECGFVYAGNIQKSMSLDNFYRQLSRYEECEYIVLPEVLAHTQRALQMISKSIFRDAEILDVGCASGELLNELKKAGFTNLAGLEPSDKNCKYVIEKHGIFCHKGMLGEQIDGLQGRRFDCIVLLAVLEHLMDLNDSIEHIKHFIKEDGMILFVVPDVELFAEKQDLYQQFSVEHINYFTINSLTNLMKRHNYILGDFDRIYATGEMITLWKSMRGDKQAGKDLRYHKSDADKLNEYIDNCKKYGIIIKERMQGYDLKQGYYIWGTGTAAAMLLQLGIISLNNVKGVFDSNPNYHGLKLYGDIVRPPEKLKEMHPLPILIASQRAYSSIEKNIMDMGLKNNIIKLFS